MVSVTNFQMAALLANTVDPKLRGAGVIENLAETLPPNSLATLDMFLRVLSAIPTEVSRMNVKKILSLKKSFKVQFTARKKFERHVKMQQHTVWVLGQNVNNSSASVPNLRDLDR